MSTHRKNTYTATELRREIAEVMRRVEVGGERIAVTRQGKIVAYLIPIAALEQLQFFTEGAGASPPTR